MAVGEEGEGGDGGCLSGEVLILSHYYILLTTCVFLVEGGSWVVKIVYRKYGW